MLSRRRVASSSDKKVSGHLEEVTIDVKVVASMSLPKKVADATPREARIDDLVGFSSGSMGDGGPAETRGHLRFEAVGALLTSRQTHKETFQLDTSRASFCFLFSRCLHRNAQECAQPLSHPIIPKPGLPFQVKYVMAIKITISRNAKRILIGTARPPGVERIR